MSEAENFHLLSADELDDRLKHVGAWCALGTDTALANHIAALQAERDEARKTIIEMVSGRYTVSEVITALVKAGFK